MRSKIDFYTAAAPIALIVGFLWIYLTMVFFKFPGWPAMVGMAGYYAVGGMACHQRHNNGSLSIKGLLLGSVVSWIGVSVWTVEFKGDSVAMGAVMGIVVLIIVLATKWRFLNAYHFAAMPQAFLGATIFFGLFNTYMSAKGVPADLLFGWLQPLAPKGGVQPHVAGVLAVFSCVAGVLLGVVHQNTSFLVVRVLGPGRDEGARLESSR